MVTILDNPALRWASTYSAVLLVVLIALTLSVARQRRNARTGLGEGTDPRLLRIVRIHGNYAENVPFLMIAMLLLAVTGVAVWPVHIVGLCAILGRAAHAQGLLQSSGVSPGRFLGMMATWAAYLLTALVLLARAWM